jgi:uncharacterized protein HemX
VPAHPRLPFARRRAKGRAAEPSPGSAATGKTAGETPSSTPQAGATPQASATPQAGGAPQGSPQARLDPDDRIDGLRAWIALVDRKLGVRTYAGAAIAVLALAAAAVALVLTLSLEQDAATEGDVQSLRDQISAVEQSATQAAQNRVESLNQRLSALEKEVDRISTAQTTTKRELKVVQDDIKELRSQVSGARGSSRGGSANGGGP